MRIKLSPSLIKITGPLLIIIAALLWSLDSILRADLRQIPPSFLVTLEHALGLIPLLPFLWIYRQHILAASIKAKVSLGVVSVLSGALGTIFYTAALGKVEYVPFSAVVLMQQLQPVFAVSAATILLKEKVDYKFVILGAFALLGAYLVSFPNLWPDLASQPGRNQALAALYALAAAFCWATGTVFSKLVLKEIDYRAATASRFFITIIAALILAVVLGQTMSISEISDDQWWKLIVIVFSAGMVALLIYYRGLAKTPARISAFAELTWPLSAFAIDLLRGFDFAETQLLGATILLIMITRIALIVRETDNNKPNRK